MASTCTASAASTSSSSSSVEPEDVPVRKHVAVDLQPCVEAAKAYLVATMAWAAAGEKLANALNVSLSRHSCSCFYHFWGVVVVVVVVVVVLLLLLLVLQGLSSNLIPFLFVCKIERLDVLLFWLV